jgi:CHAD domain-containing protein
VIAADSDPADVAQWLHTTVPMMKPEAAKNIAEYAVLQAGARLDRIAYQMGVLRKSKSPETVHELRVSIRRFMSCLKVYPQFFPVKESKKIRKRLKRVMKAAGQVRDRDIAVNMGKQANLPKDAAVLDGLRRQRKQAARELTGTLQPWSKRNVFPKWRRKLCLS